MDWINNLIFQNSIANTLLIYSFVIGIGVMLGKLKFFNISLGVTFVLFVGIIVGHWGFSIDPHILSFVKEFGLILFIFSIGLQVGPSFFASFKQGGLLLNLLACLGVFISIIIVLCLYYILDGKISMPMLVGIMTGAITTTPGLGIGQETLQQLFNTGIIDKIPEISLGYASAYPIGVLGVVMAMILLQIIGKIDLKKEKQALQKNNQNTTEAVEHINIKITNQDFNNITVAQSKQYFDYNFIISHILRDDKTYIANSKTIIKYGDSIEIIATKNNCEELISKIGESIDINWQVDNSEMIVRQIVITNEKLNGKTLASLKLRSLYQVNTTRVNRSGLDLMANDDYRLQIGDKITVIGHTEDVKRVELYLGNALTRLKQPQLTTIFFGILAGLILGSIPLYFPGMPMPAKFGSAGGALIISILIGRFGYRLKLITYTTQSANLMIREIGIALFLASVGITAGEQFFDTVIKGDGLLWIGCGAIITIVPALTVAFIARFFKINYFVIIGMLCGGVTSPAALAYANSTIDNDTPAISYATVFPLIMFLRIISVQFLILAYAV